MTSCYTQVNIEYKSGLKSFTLIPNRKHLGNTFCRRLESAFEKQKLSKIIDDLN